ncbi:hypothetical protein [Clostridium scatologenes]|uniref:Uncharacterized protein n=1 Tax=Clostridium scatologenes TaxID=1548 RepID=A0A0E3JQG0_CLOSL|nr:hypothetical protein [Clostridium scatologenes]AKA70873.1 hypothetical protein CSCA_3748 [Clostridium scatologenes]
MGLLRKLKDVIAKEFGDDDNVKLSKKFLDFLNNEADKRDKDKNRILRLAHNIDNKSDDELKRIYQTSSGDMKMAAGYLLKKRGY